MTDESQGLQWGAETAASVTKGNIPQNAPSGASTSWQNDKGEDVQLDPVTNVMSAEDEKEAYEEIAKTTAPSLDDSAQYKSAETIARVGWAAHREWEKIIGQQPRPEWEQLPQDRRNELCDSVAFIANNPHRSIAEQHDAWRAVKGLQNGATAAAKFPNFAIPFDQLPWSQQRKAWLWRHIVHAILG